ncbi:zinc finger BED domain-containing protein RICESLEEPER 2-like protein [Tanacetum coccineum]
MVFGGNTHDLGSFVEEMDEIMDLYQDSLRIMFSERGDDVTGTMRHHRDLSGNGVRDLLMHILKDPSFFLMNNIRASQANSTEYSVSTVDGTMPLKGIILAEVKLLSTRLNVRESVKFVRGSADRKIKFAECIARLKLQCCKNVRQDVVTRWNYTYLMLDCALVYRRAYVLLAKLDKKFKTCPTEEEFTRMEAITMLLKPFYDITKLFSGTLYSTSNLYFHNVYKIQKSIQRHMLNPGPVVSGMTKDMKTKFDKYWETYTMVLSFGAILDPRYKLNIIEFYLSELGMEGPLLIEKVQIVEDGLHKLYNAYEIQPNVMQSSTKGPSSNVGGWKLCDDPEDDLAGFETFQCQYKKLEIVLICIDEDEVDEKELIDEDIEKLVKSSSKIILAIAKSSMVLVSELEQNMILKLVFRFASGA